VRLDHYALFSVQVERDQEIAIASSQSRIRQPSVAYEAQSFTTKRRPYIQFVGA